MKIGVNCGHTKNGPGSGAVGKLNESKETRVVGSYLMPLLRAQGHTVIDCTVDKASTQTEYLDEAVDIANRNKCDMFISLHFNSADSKSANGTEVFTYGGKQLDRAVKAVKAVSKLGFTLRNSGECKDGSDLRVIRKTSMQAFLLEICFVDGKDAGQYKIIGAKNVAQKIASAFGEVKKTPAKKAPAKYYKKCGKKETSIAEGLKAIGVDNSYSFRKKIAKVNGIKNYAGTAAQNIKMLSLLKEGKLKKV